MPAMSVIIPVFNGEAFISEAIESVLNQQFEDFELIIVDDGSEDSTPDKIAEYGDTRIRSFRIENGGVGTARNEGISRTQAPILTFLDADDRWRPEKLAREFEVFSAEPEVGLTFSNFTRFNRDGEFPLDQFSFFQGIASIPTRPSIRGGARVVLVPPFQAFLKLYDFPAFTPSIAVRRGALGDLRFPNWRRDEEGRLMFLEDLSVIPRIFLRTSVAYFTDPLLEVRRHERNATSDSSTMARAILNSLLSLVDEPMDSSQRTALRRRIGRQWGSVAGESLENDELGEALRGYLKAATYGRPASAIKGGARMAGWLLKRAGLGERPRSSQLTSLGPENGQEARSGSSRCSICGDSSSSAKARSSAPGVFEVMVKGDGGFSIPTERK
jgi:glycosyltransferase involved in cell wall biosynthesis